MVPAAADDVIFAPSFRHATDFRHCLAAFCYFAMMIDAAAFFFFFRYAIQNTNTLSSLFRHYLLPPYHMPCRHCFADYADAFDVSMMPLLLMPLFTPPLLLFAASATLPRIALPMPPCRRHATLLLSAYALICRRASLPLFAPFSPRHFAATPLDFLRAIIDAGSVVVTDTCSISYAAMLMRHDDIDEYTDIETIV